MRITIFNFKVLLGSIDDNIFRRKQTLNTTFMCLDRRENHISVFLQKKTPQKQTTPRPPQINEFIKLKICRTFGAHKK